MKSAAAPEAAIECCYKTVYCETGVCACVLLSVSQEHAQNAYISMLWRESGVRAQLLHPAEFKPPPSPGLQER